MAATTYRLKSLLAGIVVVPEHLDREIGSIALDSRAVIPGALFLAMPGASADGRAYMNEAAARGAAAVLYEASGASADSTQPIPAIPVANLRAVVGAIADRFYGSPSHRLVVIGVTGTNGKTTCTQLLAQALDRPPRRCAVIGTLGYGFPGVFDAASHTTPDAVTVHRLLANFLERQVAYVSMEVSSHALEQGRVNGVSFDLAVFTNLTRDHLDYHGDMAAYGAAKARLFACPGLKTAVINIDDAFGRELARTVADSCNVLRYGIDAGDVHARAIHSTPAGLVIEVATPEANIEIRSPLLGRFNGANLLGVLAALLALGLDPEHAAQRLSTARPVPGRVERFGGGANAPLVIVDYAHTPDALEQVLRALRSHAQGRLWCVFGCGGDRDRGKRPLMGQIAEALADAVVLTDDNPRNESGDAIIGDIAAGMHGRPRVIRDRAAAIAAAVREAKPQDIVLVAGKGHEDYQQIGDMRRRYSDRDTVKAILGAAA